MPEFVHLSLHTEYSLVDGLIKVKKLTERCSELGMPAIAVTDQCNLYGLIKLYSSALTAGIKLIIGADVWLTDPADEEKPAKMTLLAMNDTGYQNLIQLISKSYTDRSEAMLLQAAKHDLSAVVKKEWVQAHAEGLIALSGARRGEIGRALLAQKQELAATLVADWLRCFNNRFYLELQRCGRPDDERCGSESVKLAERIGLPVVATNEVCFLSPEDFEAHEARVCINQSRVLDDARRARSYSEEQHLKSSEQMRELFADLPEALTNSVEIAKRCNVKLRLGKHFLPEYPIPQALTLEEFFAKVSREGLEHRIQQQIAAEVRLGGNKQMVEERWQASRDVYFERLSFELKIINDMEFPGYFLIVMDFIRWAKDNGIPVGPGRGSGAGSVVAWSLGITDLDPIHYDLLFERFLNPERVSMPDFDVDFCMEGRDRVIEYVADRYGSEAVSQIITFGTMSAKSVVRDVARVQGKPYSLGDRLAKLIPNTLGITLKDAVEDEQLSEYLKESEEAQEVWDMACKLEGITRNTGTHAGGVVIAPTCLTDFAPLYCEDGGKPVTQFDKNDVEEAGLVKFDFLGLRTLTIIRWALEIVNTRRQQKGEAALNIDAIPLDDQASFAVLKKAETTAVFQLESSGMKDLIRRLKPDTIEDMIALVALFRPGPLESGMVDDFINRKHGLKEVAYPHPDYQHESLKPILEPTYGVIVYQEQVMQIAQVLAGYSLGGADLLRRAMGKKKPEEMVRQRGIFEQGAKDQGIDPALAMKIFDLVEKFAGYGFNKSHSAAYALVSYQTLWLKTHYPAEFMAAVLSSDMQSTEKVVSLIQECHRMNLKVRRPDVNASEYRFSVDQEGAIVYGLGAVKGVGEGPTAAIVQARDAAGEFTDLFEFCQRLDMKKINKRSFEALLKSGALDCLGPDRAKIAALLEEATQTAAQKKQNDAMGIVDMFGDQAETKTGSDLFASVAHLPPWADRVRLAGEKESLGLYMTGHPLTAYCNELSRLNASPLANSSLGTGKGQRIAAMLADLRVVKTKRGDDMALLTLESEDATLGAVIFAENFQQVRERLTISEIYIFEGDVVDDKFSGSLKLITNSCQSLDEARTDNAKELLIQLSASSHQKHKLGLDEFAPVVKDALSPFLSSNGLPVVIGIHGIRRGSMEDGNKPSSVRHSVQQPASANARVRFGKCWYVTPSDALIETLREIREIEGVSLVY